LVSRLAYPPGVKLGQFIQAFIVSLIRCSPQQFQGFLLVLFHAFTLQIAQPKVVLTSALLARATVLLD